MTNNLHRSCPVLADNEVVLIAHANCDAGYRHARELMASGCRVVVTARQVAELTRILLGRSASEVMAIAADLEDPNQRAQLIQLAQSRFGRIVWVMDGRSGVSTALCSSTTELGDTQYRHRASGVEAQRIDLTPHP